jgi:hypothetical protein
MLPACNAETILNGNSQSRACKTFAAIPAKNIVIPELNRFRGRKKLPRRQSLFNSGCQLEDP